MKNKLKNPTSQDVAKLAGVSQSAVSRCFTKGSSISNRMRLRVIEAAKQLGYKPDIYNTNSISNDNGGLVGVILPYITNRYYPEVLTELHEALRNNGFRVLLITTDDDEEVDEKLIPKNIKDKLLAIVSATKPSDSFVTSCIENRIQVIAYNRNWNIPTTSSVACDHKAGGEQVAQYFFNNGHRNIGIVQGPDGSFVSQQRCKGFINHLKSLGINKIYIAKGSFTYEGGQEASKTLLKNKKISALFCADDTMAFGCLDYIKNNTKLKIPDQLEIIGYDDISVAEWTSYNLTTIRQPIRQMAKLTTQLILDYIKDPDFEPTDHLVQGKFIKRKTTR